MGGLTARQKFPLMNKGKVVPVLNWVINHYPMKVYGKVEV
jgi:hypothetical protein